MAVDHNNPQSRNEEILITTIDGKEYDKAPQSRIEELLLELKETIEEGGGGGGTNNYNNLENLPQINNNTLTGNKSASDLGLADSDTVDGILNGTDIDSFGDVETALANKQNTLTAGNYISIANDGTINVTQSIGVYDVYSYVVAGRYGSNYYYVDIQKYKNGVLQSNTRYVNDQTYDKKIIDDRFSLQYNVGGDFSWHFVLLTDSNEHKEGESIVWRYNVTKDFTETFNVSQDSSTDLATKGDITTALSPILDGQNIDSFGGVESALALKQDKTDNNLDTEAKTIVGAINEHEGDIDSLKSGFTNLDNEVNGDATVYPYADAITIEDAVPSNLADCSVKIEPVQDLHGQSAPYVGGAGKNKLPLVLATLKSLNTDGTWNDNVYTINNGTITVNTDDGGNVTSIKTNGTFNANTTFNLMSDIKDVLAVGTDIIINGCPLGGGATRYVITANNVGNDTGDGVSGAVPSIVSKVAILIYASYNVDNLLFKPMIRLATETDATFAPYTNICPISGHTEASVQRDGKNLFDASAVTTGKGIIEDSSLADSDISCVSDYIRVMPNTTYYLTTHNDDGNRRVGFYDKYRNNLQASTAAKGSRAFTTPANCAYCRVSVATSYAGETQLELDSAAKTYTIALGDTIYGGTVDFDSGVMTVTRKCVDLGSLNFTYDENQRFTIALSDMKSASIREAHFITSCYLTIDDGRPYSQVPDFSAYAGWGGTDMMLSIHDSRYSDAATYKTAITGQTICYELATPTTIQLTPQQIQLLKGTNTLTASTGQISVTVNGVSGAIGAVQEQVNELAEDVAEIKPLNYSTTEQKTGQKWIDGKDIYVKTFNAGALPSSGNLTVQNDITNFGSVVNVETVGISNDGYSFANYGLIMSYANASTLVFRVTFDATGYNGYVTVYYTKTT